MTNEVRAQSNAEQKCRYCGEVDDRCTSTDEAQECWRYSQAQSDDASADRKALQSLHWHLINRTENREVLLGIVEDALGFRARADKVISGASAGLIEVRDMFRQKAHACDIEFKETADPAAASAAYAYTEAVGELERLRDRIKE